MSTLKKTTVKKPEIKETSDKKYILVDFLNDEIDSFLTKEELMALITKYINDGNCIDDVLDENYFRVVEMSTGKIYKFKLSYELTETENQK